MANKIEHKINSSEKIVTEKEYTIDLKVVFEKNMVVKKLDNGYCECDGCQNGGFLYIPRSSFSSTPLDWGEFITSVCEEHLDKLGGLIND